MFIYIKRLFLFHLNINTKFDINYSVPEFDNIKNFLLSNLLSCRLQMFNGNTVSKSQMDSFLMDSFLINKI